MNRPVAVTILAILAALAGVWAIVDVLRYLGLLPVAWLGSVAFFGFSFLGAILAVIAALIWFWAAQRLWNLDAQGWTFMMAMAVIYLVFDFVAMLGGTSFQSLIPSIVICAVVLILGLVPGTRAAFGQA